MAKRAEDDTFLFELRIPLYWRGQPKRFAVVRAFEASPWKPDGSPHYDTGHTKIDLELRFGGKTLWKRGETYVGTPRGMCIDGPEAKALALSVFAMRPGDTDPEFFECYTPEQLAFVGEWADELTMAREERFGEDS